MVRYHHEVQQVASLARLRTDVRMCQKRHDDVYHSLQEACSKILAQLGQISKFDVDKMLEIV
jgi:Asp-tRNA(Asn)/Glu-tRNA(Gln) amidotransferase C subunit